jgi:Uma2 family endonuclease
MSATAEVRPARRTYQPEDLEAMEANGFAFEIGDCGELEERGMSWLTSMVAVAIISRLADFNTAHRLGYVISGDVGIRAWPARPRRYRRVDAGFISSARAPKDFPTWLSVAPDLAIEVVSRGDDATTLVRKVFEYIEAGSLLVWTIYPERGMAVVFRADGTTTAIQYDGALEGEAVLPGITMKLAEIMPDPATFEDADEAELAR